ncbi:SDR family oxidoreductase [Butyrivibrio sp. YAB3001]|uniref:SDR family oxidoreductase n=1 Tax=Butyrivibrio sp. YAB3001 TaxID=1520812 RepID=UPI001A9A4009|nr:SDR family oxidoreductase [Butyrivibrio sp. YAB3001]
MKNAGNLLFISSERGKMGDDLPYGLTKAAINSLIKGLARRGIDYDIRVNGIVPGVTVSDMVGVGENDNLYRKKSIGKRIYLPEEIAELAVFLMSDISGCISGEVIACDQGNYHQLDDIL